MYVMDYVTKAENDSMEVRRSPLIPASTKSFGHLASAVESMALMRPVTLLGDHLYQNHKMIKWIMCLNLNKKEGG